MLQRGKSSMWRSEGPNPGILPLLMVPSQVRGAFMAPSLLRTVTTALCSLTLHGSSPPHQVHLHRSCSWLESSRGRSSMAFPGLRRVSRQDLGSSLRLVPRLHPDLAPNPQAAKGANESASR